MAYEFNGTTQGLHASATVTAMPLTMACWFYAASGAISGSLVALGSGASNGEYYSVGVRGDLAGDPVRVATVGSSGTSVGVADSTVGFNTSAWNHAAGVFGGTTNRIAYSNGSGTTNTASATAPTVTQTSIGYIKRLTDGIFVAAIVAEVGIWSVALTEQEIKSLADGITCDKVRPQSLVFYAPLVRDLIDYKGGLTITNNNTATVAAHTRVYA
jgi:hypothetical protein